MLAPQPRHLQTPIRYAKHLEEEAVKPQIEFIGLVKKHFTLNVASQFRQLLLRPSASAQTPPFAIYTHTRTRTNTHAQTHTHKFNGI